MTRIPPQFKMDKDAMEKTKLVFLEEYRKKFSLIKGSKRSFHYFAVGFASGMAVILIVSGSAVYADQKDVGVNSFLYPMKRIYESVNLNLSGETEKPVLQAEFAGRRLNEIENMRNKDLDNPKISGLLKDLETSVKESITALPAVPTPAPSVPQTSDKAEILNVPPSTSTLNATSIPQTIESVIQPIELTQPTSSVPTPDTSKPICKSLDDLFAHDSPFLGIIIKGNLDLWEKFEANCGSLIGEEELRRIYEKQQENIRQAEDLEKNDDDRNSGPSGDVKGEEAERNDDRRDGQRGSK